MKRISDETAFFTALFDAIEKQLGNNTELVLYDFLSSDPVVDIRNANISNGAASFGERWPAGDLSHAYDDPKTLFNYVYTRANGNILRCSASYLFDDNNNPIGAICINQDITKTLELERAFCEVIPYPSGTISPFAVTVNDALDLLIDKATADIDKPLNQLEKCEKMEIIRTLDKCGAFLVTRSVDKVCALLGISKYTFYSYLDNIRG